MLIGTSNTVYKQISSLPNRKNTNKNQAGFSLRYASWPPEYHEFIYKVLYHDQLIQIICMDNLSDC